MPVIVFILANAQGEYVQEPHAGTRWTRDRMRAVRFRTRAEAVSYARTQRILIHPTDGAFPMWVWIDPEKSNERPRQAGTEG